MLDAINGDLGKITGQKAMPCKAHKSIANFKLREGMVIGAKVTLRGERECTSSWISCSTLLCPRVRDFRGINGNSFDGRGDYNLGIREQPIFPRSSTIRSIRSAAWTSPLLPPPRPMKKPKSC